MDEHPHAIRDGGELRGSTRPRFTREGSPPSAHEEPEEHMSVQASVAPPPTVADRPSSLHLVPPVPADPVLHLTPREREVMALMAEGRSNHAICKALFISPKTLERHVQHVFRKFDLPPSPEDHRRVRAVLAWMESPFGGRPG